MTRPWNGHDNVKCRHFRCPFRKIRKRAMSDRQIGLERQRWTLSETSCHCDSTSFFRTRMCCFSKILSRISTALSTAKRSLTATVGTTLNGMEAAELFPTPSFTCISYLSSTLGWRMFEGRHPWRELSITSVGSGSVFSDDAFAVHVRVSMERKALGTFTGADSVPNNVPDQKPVQQ